MPEEHSSKERPTTSGITLNECDLPFRNVGMPQPFDLDFFAVIHADDINWFRDAHFLSYCVYYGKKLGGSTRSHLFLTDCLKRYTNQQMLRISS